MVRKGDMMLQMLFGDIILFSALAMISIALAAFLILPSRKKMMLKEIRAPRRRIKLAYTMAALLFVYAGVLFFSSRLYPSVFEGIVGGIFLYSNSVIMAGMALAMTLETRWVSRFSSELGQSSITKVEIMKPAEPTLSGDPEPATPPALFATPGVIHLQCPVCCHQMAVPHESLGHIISCPSCGAEGRIGGQAQ